MSRNGGPSGRRVPLERGSLLTTGPSGSGPRVPREEGSLQTEGPSAQRFPQGKGSIKENVPSKSGFFREKGSLGKAGPSIKRLPRNLGSLGKNVPSIRVPSEKGSLEAAGISEKMKTMLHKIPAMGFSLVFRERVSETLGNRCCFRMFLFLFL